MKFIYRYQDPARGVVEGEVTASSKADAYSSLRQSGIRPMNVWPKPGLVNAVARFGKRGAAIVALSILCLAAIAYGIRSGRTVAEGTEGSRRQPAPLPRQQVAAANVDFAFRAERTLSKFARPGDVSFLDAAGGREALDMSDLPDCLGRPLEIGSGEPDQAVVLKRVVIGLKEEAAMLRRSGRDADQVLEYLISRQRMEAEYRRLAVQRVKRSPSDREKTNAMLGQMGMAPITEEEISPIR